VKKYYNRSADALQWCLLVAEVQKRELANVIIIAKCVSLCFLEYATSNVYL
jgi:hypothetical protein